jgi:hypothetical protein
MKTARHLAFLFVTAFCCQRIHAQNSPGKPAPPKSAPANPWAFNLSVSGYIVPQGQSYVSPTLTADRDTLHLEARYNYEEQRTGSVWAGYNFSVGKKVTLDLTPMIGGVFGAVNGIAPGLEFTVTYKKLQLYSANEYLFDTTTKSGNFFLTWTQLTYSPLSWFGFGYATQRTRAYSTPLDIQNGPFLEFSHKKLSFTAQVFNIGQTDPIYSLTLGYNF